jgi:hypothetical protein
MRMSPSRYGSLSHSRYASAVIYLSLTSRHMLALTYLPLTYLPLAYLPLTYLPLASRHMLGYDVITRRQSRVMTCIASSSTEVMTSIALSRLIDRTHTLIYLPIKDVCMCLPMEV